MRRAWWWIGLVTMIAVLVLAKSFATQSHPALDPTRDYSCERTNKWGTKGLRELCEWRGLQTEVWRHSLAYVGQGEGTVCILAPQQPLSKDERANLERWVRAGGHLIVAAQAETPTDGTGDQEHLTGGHQAMAWLGIALKIRKYGAPSEQLEVAAVPKEWAGYDVARLSTDLPPSLVWQGDKAKIAAALKDMGAGEKALKALPDPAATELGGQLKDGDGDVLGIALTLGKGRIDVLSDVEILSNQRLGKEDNALLAAAVILGGKGPVVFDEYHHGLAPGGEGARAGAVVTAALWILMLALLLAILPGWGSRMGKARPYASRPRRTIGEYVRATAWLYQGAGMTLPALEMLGHDVRRRWANKLGVRIDAPPEEFELAAKLRGLKVGPRLSRVFEDLAALQPDEKITRVHLLWLGAELTSLKREWANRG